jgi:hypothetical protein
VMASPPFNSARLKRRLFMTPATALPPRFGGAGSDHDHRGNITKAAQKRSPP